MSVLGHLVSRWRKHFAQPPKVRSMADECELIRLEQLAEIECEDHAKHYPAGPCPGTECRYPLCVRRLRLYRGGKR